MSMMMEHHASQQPPVRPSMVVSALSDKVTPPPSHDHTPVSHHCALCSTVSHHCALCCTVSHHCALCSTVLHTSVDCVCPTALWHTAGHGGPHHHHVMTWGHHHHGPTTTLLALNVLTVWSKLLKYSDLSKNELFIALTIL